MYYPSLPEVIKLAEQADLVPVYREIVADLETPVSAFLKINKLGQSFLLESVEGGERLARYSFIGTEPRRIITIDENDPVGALEEISGELQKYRVANLPGLPRFSGGAVGYLAYETVRRFEELPAPEKDSLELPEAIFMFVDTMLVFDHVTQRIKILSMVHTNGDIVESYRQAIARIDELALRLESPVPVTTKRPQSTDCDTEIRSTFSRQNFEGAVIKAKEYITSGEAIQVVLSQRLLRNTNAPPFDIYRTLRSINPSPYMYYFDFGDFQIIGTSPEVLVRVEDGTVMTRPLAGTRPRGTTVPDDIRMEQELRNDEKERAEHIMLVDLGRNDIGRVSEPGSVKLNNLMDVERYSHVMHLVTHVEGKLSKDFSVYDALRVCFPAGTVSGAPKIRAMEIIAELEPERRGVYAGAVGYFSYSGNMDMAIAIRTMIVTKGKAYVQAGCGIVYDSVPEKEYEETLNKAKALLSAIDYTENHILGREHAAADR